MAVGNDSLLFIHVPKTGGWWAMKAMRAAGIELDAERDRHHLYLFECDPRERFVFGFVREPLSWHGSLWNDRRMRAKLPTWPVEDPDFSLSFPDYLERILENEWSLTDYYDSFLGAPGEIDFIGKTENLVGDLVRALTLAGQEFDEQALRSVPPDNVSAPTPPCPDEIKERLRFAEREVYARFYGPVVA